MSESSPEPERPCTCDGGTEATAYSHRWWCGLTEDEIEAADREHAQEMAGYEAFPQ